MKTALYKRYQAIIIYHQSDENKLNDFSDPTNYSTHNCDPL